MAMSVKSLVGAPAQPVQRVELEGDYVCWRLRWVKQYPENKTIHNADSMVLVDNSGYVYVGGSEGETFYIWIYDVDGNLVGSYTFTNFTWGGVIDANWGHYFSQNSASSASYLVIATHLPATFYVFRYRAKVWEWDLAYDNIQKGIYGTAISPNGKYIAFTLASTEFCDSVALYEGISDSSLCPKPPI